MIMRRFVFLIILMGGLLSSVAAGATWQEEWDRVVKAAKQEYDATLVFPENLERHKNKKNDGQDNIEHRAKHG